MTMYLLIVLILSQPPTPPTLAVGPRFDDITQCNLAGMLAEQMVENNTTSTGKFTCYQLPR